MILFVLNLVVVTCWIIAVRTGEEGADQSDVSLSTNEGDLRLMAVCSCMSKF